MILEIVTFAEDEGLVTIVAVGDDREELMKAGFERATTLDLATDGFLLKVCPLPPCIELKPTDREKLTAAPLALIMNGTSKLLDTKGMTEQ